MRQTSRRLIIIIGLFLFIAIGAMGYITLSSATNAITLEASSKLENLVLHKAAELDTQLTTVEASIKHVNALSEITLKNYTLNTTKTIISDQSFADNLEFVINQSFDQLTFVESTFFVSNPDVIPSTDSFLFRQQEDGSYKSVSPQEFVKNIDTHSDESNWFHLPLLKKEGYWSDLIFNQTEHTYMVTYSEPLIVNNQLIAVIGANMYFEDFEKFVSNIRVFQDGYAFLLNRNHDNLVHPIFDKDTNMRTIDNGLFIPISNKINTSHHGVQHYEFYNNEKIMAYAHLHNGWILGLAPTLRDMRSGLMPTKNKFYISFIASIILFIIIGLMASQLMFKDIESAESDQTQTKDQVLMVDRLNQKNDQLTEKLKNQELTITSIQNELKSSKTALESAERTIIELREQKMVIDLVQHITTKLSNPIATSMTAASYMIEKSNALSEINGNNQHSDISKSAMLINNNQQQMKTILDSLKQLTAGLNLETPRHFPIKAQVHHTVSNELSVHSVNDIQLTINADDQLMAYLPIDMFSKLMSDLTHHSIRAAKAFPARNINIQIYKDEHFAYIIYEDIIPWKFGIDDRIFNPYYQDEFSKDGSGLELFIIKHTVGKIFLGDIVAFETENGRVGFHIKLPISQ